MELTSSPHYTRQWLQMIWDHQSKAL